MFKHFLVNFVCFACMMFILQNFGILFSIMSNLVIWQDVGAKLAIDSSTKFEEKYPKVFDFSFFFVAVSFSFIKEISPIT